MKFSAQTKASPVNWKDLAHVFRDAGYNVFPKKEGYEGGIRVILRGQFSFLDYLPGKRYRNLYHGF